MLNFQDKNDLFLNLCATVKDFESECILLTPNEFGVVFNVLRNY